VRQAFETLKIPTRGAGLYPFTEESGNFLRKTALGDGLLTCFIRHTSASLLVQENADPDVLLDLEGFMRRIVSRDESLYRHTAEGPDDMPGHIRSALTQSSLSIPFRAGRLALGTWQALYVFEHRDAPHTREVLLHAMGD
jgi:secondary thiamine-phosphate synthase enzyme